MNIKEKRTLGHLCKTSHQIDDTIIYLNKLKLNRLKDERKQSFLIIKNELKEIFKDLPGLRVAFSKRVRNIHSQYLINISFRHTLQATFEFYNDTYHISYDRNHNFHYETLFDNWTSNTDKNELFTILKEFAQKQKLIYLQ